MVKTYQHLISEKQLIRRYIFGRKLVQSKYDVAIHNKIISDREKGKKTHHGPHDKKNKRKLYASRKKKISISRVISRQNQ